MKEEYKPGYMFGKVGVFPFFLSGLKINKFYNNFIYFLKLKSIYK
jgi:hypothetical protein